MMEQQHTVAFNMGLATLERMNNLLISLANYNLVNNVSSVRNTLLELYKESSGYMNKDERKEAIDHWQKISGCYINWTEHNTVEFDNKILGYLTDFDFWLRDLLYSKGILMPNLGRMKGLDKLKESYNMKKNATN